MTRIFIEGYELDLTQGLSNQITYAIDDLQSIDSKSTSFTKTIVLPGTDNNNKLLGNIFDFNNANFDNPNAPNVLANFNAARNASARIEIDGLQIMKGVLRLLEIVHIDGAVEYECALFGELGGFINALGNKRLEDLDFSAYNHTYNYTNIKSSWDTSGSTGYCYPLIDYGNVSTDKVNFQYTTFKPALFVREYLTKIFASSGYTYECALFDTANFRKLIIPNNQKQLTKETNNVLQLTKSTTQNMNTITSVDFVSYPTKVGSLFTSASGDTQFEYTGSVTLTTTFTINISGNYSVPTAGEFTLSVIKNDVLVEGTSQTFTGAGSIYYSKTVDLVINANDKIRVKSEGLLEDFDYLNITSSDITVLNSVATTAPIELGDTMLINNTIPKGIFQKDFVTSIMKMFNLMIVEDKYKSNHLIIKPYVDFYNGEIVDWTYKLDHSKAVKLKPMSEINARYYNFKYKQDNDFYNEEYRKKFNEGYGDRVYDNGLEFAKDTESVEIIFAPSPLYGTNSTDKIFPAIYKKSDNNTKEDPMDHIIRIMIINKITGVASWDVRNGAETLGANNYYLYAGHLNNPTNPSTDINFGAPQQLFFNLTAGNLTYNLFNLYYSAYMSEITDKDSRLLTGFFDLKELDIFNIDFAKFIYLDGGLYRLQKIYDYSPENNETTKVDLLRVIDKFNLVVDTTPNFVNQGFNTCVECTNYIVYKDINEYSTTYNNYMVNNVNVGATAPVSGNCVVLGNWVSQGYTTCLNCGNYTVEKDTNPCSSTYLQYRANGVVLGLTAPASGNCDVVPNWVNQGYSSCYNCVYSIVYKDTKLCSPTYNKYKVGDTILGYTAPSSAPCNTTANYSEYQGLLYTCSNGDVISQNIFKNSNPCFTGRQYLNASTLDTYEFNPVNSYPDTTPNLGYQGYNVCVSCVNYGVYRDVNQCSATYNDYFINGSNVGATAPMASSCDNVANFSIVESGELWKCVNGVATSFYVYRNSNPCYFGPQWSSDGNLYSSNPVNQASDLNPVWQNIDIYTDWVCIGYDQYYKQRDANPQSCTYNQTRTGALYQANSSVCGYTPPTNYRYSVTRCYTGGPTYIVSPVTLMEGATYSNASSGQGECYSNVSFFETTTDAATNYYLISYGEDCGNISRCIQG